MTDPRVRVLTRMALSLLVLATAASVGATGRLTFPLLLSGIACWSFVPVVQLLTGLLLVRGCRVERSLALDGYFATHRPWSLWLLAIAALVLFLPGDDLLYLAATGVIPAALTARALTRFSREVLGDTAPASRRRVAIHQAATFALVLTYAELSVALWPRIVGASAR